MIDIYDRVFGTVYRAAKGANGNVTVQDAYIGEPPSFPLVTVQETDNSTASHIIGNRTTENAARVTYQIEVYSNANDTRRSECRAIMAAISDALIASNFDRELLYATPNYADATVYRLTARFRTIADTNNNTYRR